MWSLFFVFMGVQAILGQKIDQSQKFLEDGTRIPVTQLWVKGNVVVAVKTQGKHNYSAIQLGFGAKKKKIKESEKVKGASLKQAPKFLKEARVSNEDSLPGLGEVINATEIFKPGDIVNATGISKGKGYAGVVKRHNFKGGPRTHGQSDRERAPGSIGQTTTPGRVYKGKRMAGRMGNETVTIKNLEVVGVSEDSILVKGLVPGGKNTMIMIKKVGENKKFVPLYQEKIESKDVSDLPVSDDTKPSEEEQSVADSSPVDEIQEPEVIEEPSSEPSSEVNNEESKEEVKVAEKEEVEDAK